MKQLRSNVIRAGLEALYFSGAHHLFRPIFAGVGSILMLIGATKAFVAGAISSVVCLIFASGALLLLLGVVAPSRLSTLNRLWLKVGTAIAKVVNPIILALLFFLVVTPMAFFMRIVGKRPLRLAADRTAATYWIEREPPAGGASTMRRQF